MADEQIDNHHQPFGEVALGVAALLVGTGLWSLTKPRNERSVEVKLNTDNTDFCQISADIRPTPTTKNTIATRASSYDAWTGDLHVMDKSSDGPSYSTEYPSMFIHIPFLDTITFTPANFHWNELKLAAAMRTIGHALSQELNALHEMYVLCI
jgi:hypothetical protein